MERKDQVMADWTEEDRRNMWTNHERRMKEVERLNRKYGVEGYDESVAAGEENKDDNSEGETGD